jgi:hypothetical protein
MDVDEPDDEDEQRELPRERFATEEGNTVIPPTRNHVYDIENDFPMLNFNDEVRLPVEAEEENNETSDEEAGPTKTSLALRVSR